MAKEFYQLIRSFGGLSLEYASIDEADFAGTAGAAYTPPERGDYRRIAGSREIQLLSDAPGIIETFQTVAVGNLFLPANTLSEDTNDSGNGRLFFLKNSGSEDLIIKTHIGTVVWTMPADTSVMAVGNALNNWDFYFKADDIYFENALNYYKARTIKEALEENDFRPDDKYPVGFVERDDTEMSFVDGTRIFTIQPKAPSTEFRVYIQGYKFDKTSAESVTLDATEGLWYIFYDVNGSLQKSQTPWDLAIYAPVALVYWDATNNKHIYFGEERHGISMTHATHARLHLIEGAKTTDGSFEIGNYILGGDGSLDIHAQCSFTEGTLIDEDIIMDTVQTATPTEIFEQNLDPICYLPVYYRDGVNNWRREDATAFPVLEDSPNTLRYNLNTGGVWSSPNAPEDSYLASWIYATNNMSEPLVVVLGQAINASLLDGDDANLEKNLDLSNFPAQEISLVKRLMFKTSTSFANTPKAGFFVPTDPGFNIVAPDRYTFTAQLTGNAGVNKYLEFFPGIGSDEAPFLFPEASYIRTITINTAATNSGVIGFFYPGPPAVLAFSINVVATDSHVFDGLSHQFTKNDELYCRVISGSFSKPALRIWVQTDLGSA